MISHLAKWPLVFSATMGSGAEAGAVAGRVAWNWQASLPFLTSSGVS